MYLIGNGILVTRDEKMPFVKDGAAVIDGGVILAAGPFGELREGFPEAEFIDAHGGVIMPGLINAHTHFYTSLLLGSGLPQGRPSSLFELLRAKSWRLDRELSLYDTVNSAYAGALECIKNGVTTVFDHHAATGCAPGSLMAAAGAVEESGIRGCLCHETSRRGGFTACSASIAENADFIDYCSRYPSGRIKAMFGLHAPFTLSDLDIEDCVRKNAGRTGFHIHVSEGLEDRCFCLQNYGKTPVSRLAGLGVAEAGSILAHCVHVSDEETDLLASTGAFVVNCPASNMNNAVGTAPVLGMLGKGVSVGLGTDSVTYDMLESARSFISAQRSLTGDPCAGLAEVSKMLFVNNAEFASRYFGKDIGVLKEGAPADIVIMDYSPFTPMNESNFDAHIIMGMSGRDAVTVMADGKLLMRDRQLLTLDGKRLASSASRETEALWKRIAESGEEYPFMPPVNE